MITYGGFIRNMMKTIIKIAFRNFKMHMKTAFVLILGVGVPSMLIVGGLSINDTIKNWITSSFSESFDPADAYVESRRSNIFLKVSLENRILDALREQPSILKILLVSESLGRVELDGKIVDCLVVGVNPSELEEFVGRKVQFAPGEAIISKTIANVLDIREGAILTINVGAGERQLTVKHIGNEGFLNFRGDSLHYNGTVFVHTDDFLGPGGFPTRAYLSLEGNLKNHQTIVEELRRTFNVRAVAMKSELLNSPANRALGYLTIAFSGFSILASFILVYLFAQSFVEERNSTMATLRIIGSKTNHIAAMLLIEGLSYLLVAGILGGTLGIFLARYLLNRFLVMASVLNSSFGLVFGEIKLYISPLTIVVGVLAGLIVPILIFVRRIQQLSKRSPVQMLSIYQSGPQNSIFPKFKKILGVSLGVFGALVTLTVGRFWMFGLLLAAVGLFLVFSHPIVSLALGMTSIGIVSYFEPNEMVGGWEILQRGAVFFVGSWLIFVYAIVLLRKLISKIVGRTSVSSFIALSYVERNRRNSFVIASMFSLIVFVMILVITVPTNVQRFVRSKLENGLFGYDFMVIRNPLKLILSRSEIEIADGVTGYSRVYIAEFEEDLIAFVDENFLQNASIPLEMDEEWRRELLQPGKAIVGYLQEDSFEDIVGKTIKGKVRSPFRIGGTTTIELEVIDKFNMRQLMVPTRYVASINSIPKEIRTIPVLLAKVDPKKVSQIKNFYGKAFDFPVYITEELNRLFSGVDMLIQTAIALLYFGLISGFSGIAFHSLRTVVVRKRLAGTLRAVGMSSRSVSTSFVVENVVIASLGILVGSFAGYLESRDILRLIFKLFGSGEFSFPLENFLTLICAIYVVILIIVSLPVVLVKRSPADALRTPE